MWTPYQIGIVPKIRSIQTNAGLGDRLRLVAFAERQAFHAFNDAAARFKDAPMGLIEAWKQVALDEQRHENWLLERLKEIGEDVAAVPVSLNLYHSLSNCTDAKSFSLYVADAETRGKVGAEKFAELLEKKDPITAKIFAQIAFEERSHIELVTKYFP